MVTPPPPPPPPPQAPTPPPPARRRRPPVRKLALSTALLRTIAISAVVVALVFGGLTLQMALGRDPAIGPGGSTAAQPAQAVTSDDDEVALPQQTVPAPAPVQTSTS